MQKLIDIAERLLPKFLVNYFKQGHQRSQRTKRSILASMLLKAVGIGVSFLLAPLMVDYLGGQTGYGIWTTLYSVIALYGFAELGLGNGMRNKFAEAIARGDHELARSYISTTYGLVALIVVAFYVVFLGILPYIDWHEQLGVQDKVAEDLTRIVILLFSYFSMQLIFKLIGMVLVADQKPAVGRSLDTLGSVISLIVVYILTQTTDGSIFYLGLAVCGSNLVVKMVATFWFFGFPYRKYAPSLRYFKLKYARPLVGLGMQFFVMQFAGNIVFSTDNIIITKVLGVDQVTPYDLALKYYRLVIILFTTVTIPLWSAYTEAYVKGEMQWIRNVTRKFIRFWLVLFGITMVMVLACDLFFDIWMDGKVTIPLQLSLFMAAYVLIRTFSDIFYYLMYGASKIRLSLYVSVIASIVNIPLSVWLAGPMGLGISGVMLGTCLTILPDLFLAPIQYRKIMRGTAKGIWNE